VIRRTRYSQRGTPSNGKRLAAQGMRSPTPQVFETPA
jgi:hypothetical protein